MTKTEADAPRPSGTKHPWRTVAHRSLWVVYVVVLIEVGAWIGYRVWSGTWLDRAALQTRRQQIAEQGDPATRRSHLDVLPHPYVGRTRFPADLATHTNPEYALTFSDEIPLTASEDRVVVALFGGSVAQFLGESKSFVRAIENVPSFSGRRVVLLLVATASWKQPQQVMALTYLFLLGYHIDVVINLDGYNELNSALYSASLNMCPYYPDDYMNLIAPYEDPRRVAIAGQMRAIRKTRRKNARRFNAPLLRRSPLANLVWAISDDSKQTALQLRGNEIRALPSSGEYDFAHQGPRYDFGNVVEDPMLLLREMARFWAASSLRMHQLCQDNGIIYLHFLQPSQYLTESKPLTTEERQIAVNSANTRRLVHNGYPLLLEALPTLVQQGVAAFDLTPIFRDVTESIYVDNCCHVNELGNNIISERMRQEIERAVRQKPAATSPH